MEGSCAWFFDLGHSTFVIPTSVKRTRALFSA
jgi:hypothetical protein